jgi:hypothetical protein
MARLVTEISLEHLPVRLDLCRRAGGENLAFDHAYHARTQPHDEVHVVLDHDKASALRLVQLQQQLAKLIDETGVDASTRLVEQHQARSGHERHGDVDQLLLPVRQIARRHMSHVLQAKHLDHLVGVVAESCVGLCKQATRHGALELLGRGNQIVANGQLDEHLQRLKCATDAAP